MIYVSEWTLKRYLAAEGVLISRTGKFNTTYSPCILFFLHRPWKPDKYSNCEIESGHLHDDDGLCF